MGLAGVLYTAVLYWTLAACFFRVATGFIISALRVCFQEGMFSGRLQSFELL